MRAFVLHAHPVPESFSGALRHTVVDTLESKGWDVDLCDLYKENFNPILSAEERRNYHTVPANQQPVASYVERFQRADGLFLVYPVWIFGFPAILKGFFDRVMLPGVAFELDDGNLRPVSSSIDYVYAVATYGGTRLRAALTLDPPRQVVNNNFRFYCRPKVLRYLALYDMNNADETRRRNFIKKVKNEVTKLP